MPTPLGFEKIFQNFFNSSMTAGKWGKFQNGANFFFRVCHKQAEQDPHLFDCLFGGVVCLFLIVYNPFPQKAVGKIPLLMAMVSACPKKAKIRFVVIDECGSV